MTDQIKTAGIAIWSLVLGILGLTCIGPIGAIPAIVCGHIGLSKIKKAAGALSGQGMAIAGLVLGYVGLVLSVLILPALLLPAVSQAKQKAYEVRAQAEAQSIRMAVKAYYSEYGRLPDGETAAKIITVLMGSNPRQIMFLDVSDASFRESTFVDPWSQGYAIELDSNYDGVVTLGDETIRDVCAVWSYGPNKRDEKGLGDDVASWK